MSGKNDRFTGADSLTPGTLKHSVHLAMMSNELEGGRGAYRIGNAVLAESGPSFGPFQYDLGSSPQGRLLFERIAATAVDANGRRIVGSGDLQDIKDHLYKSFKEINASKESSALFERLRPVMDKALSSEAGRRLINQDYLANLEKKVESLNTTIAAVPDRENRTFLQSNRLAQLIIVDTANQYGPAVNQGLHQLMGMDAGSKLMSMPLRKPKELIGVNGELGIEDMIRYKLETQYGQTNAGARDVLRRISNLIEAAGPGNIALSKEDQRFFGSGLRQYLIDNGRDPRILDHPELKTLREFSAPFKQSTPTAAHATSLDHGVIECLRPGICSLDRVAGKGWDDNSERLLASSYGLALQQGFKPGDDIRVAFNNATAGQAAGDTLFVYRQGVGASPDPAANRGQMTMAEALSMSAEQRYREVGTMQEARVEAQLQRGQGPFAPIEDDATRRGPVVS